MSRTLNNICGGTLEARPGNRYCLVRTIFSGVTPSRVRKSLLLVSPSSQAHAEAPGWRHDCEWL